jgi:hypothetical protein
VWLIFCRITFFLLLFLYKDRSCTLNLKKTIKVEGLLKTLLSYLKSYKNNNFEFPFAFSIWKMRFLVIPASLSFPWRARAGELGWENRKVFCICYLALPLPVRLLLSWVSSWRIDWFLTEFALVKVICGIWTRRGQGLRSNQSFWQCFLGKKEKSLFTHHGFLVVDF